MHEAGIKNLVTISPIPALEDAGDGHSAVDIWVLLPVMYDHSKGEVEKVLKKGDEVWSYNTLVQDAYSPKWEIDFPPADFRIQPGFIDQSLGLTGLLYWRVDDWTGDPWNNVYAFSGSYPGEGALVYPGKQVGVQRDAGRPIYEVEFGGTIRRVAVTTGSNGFIVGANLRSSK